MDRIKTLQELLEVFSQISYQGAYLWKYVEYELTSGIMMDYQNQNTNTVIKKWNADYNPLISLEKGENTKKYLKSLTKKDILFGLMPIRKMYHGKLEHTSCDPYIQVLEEDEYVVLELDNHYPTELISTKNRVCYDPEGVLSLYGVGTVDKADLIKHFVENFIYPIEKAYSIKFSSEVLISCILKLSAILKERKAFISFFTDVLDVVKPKVVCFTYGKDHIICFLREAAQQLNIPTIEVEHGGIILNMRYPDSLSYSDYYMTHSQLLTDKMLERGLRRVYTAGKPFIYTQMDCCHVNKEKPITITFISSMETELFLAAESLAGRLDKNKYQIIFKTHPVEHWSQEDKISTVKKFKNWLFADGSEDVRDIYAKSDIVVGIRSSGLLDALPFHELKIVVLKDKFVKELLLGNVDEIYSDLERLGDIVRVEGEEELFKEIVEYERGKSYRGKINHYWPQDAEEKFRRFIQIFTEGRRPAESESYMGWQNVE